MSLLNKCINAIKEMFSNVEDAMSDTGRDGKYAIQKAKAELAEFKTKFADLKTQTKSLTAQVESLKLKRIELEHAAIKAKEAGDKDGAMLGLTAMSEIDKKIETTSTQINNNKTVETAIKAEIDKYQTKIDEAENKLSNLEVRETAAEMREQTAAALAGLGASGGLAELDELEKKVIEQESRAAALEEIGSQSTSADALVQKYKTMPKDSDLESQFEKLGSK